ncbi:hypothetical protein ANN_21569 [Periplaneta americana]|uniref:Uncharacterized protein n=1 Tax=Periplaneta americana TaxID=6978 RepID=A0ABQ8S6G0_PERAM|nr:hypothetical protein ANN_21569 [Periplaneta americana]
MQEEFNRRFPEGGLVEALISWPARNPDLNLLDFFLWSYIKNNVYSENVPNLVVLKERMRQAIITSLIPDVFPRV